jgi:hypothetical protein
VGTREWVGDLESQWHAKGLGASSNSFTRIGICPKFEPQNQNYVKHTNQQRRNDPLEVINTAEKEWDQLDTRLVKYGQSSEQISD